MTELEEKYLNGELDFSPPIPDKFATAMKCINSIEDFFEYRYKSFDKEGIKSAVLSHITDFTKEVSK